MNKLINKINNERQTVKSYSNKKIPMTDWNQILDSIYWSPSSHGFEPYRVLIIKKNNKLRKILKEHMWNQGVITEADKLIFFISLDRKSFTNKKWTYERALRRQLKVVGAKGEEAKINAQKHADIILNKHLKIEEPVGDDWSMKQAYIALGVSLTTSSILGIGSTPMEGLEKEKIEKLFKKNKLISNNERVAVAVAFGYPKSKTAYAHYGTNKRIRDPKKKKFTTI